MSNFKKVAILHPWLPQYRTTFFDVLRDRCLAKGIELDVFYGQTPREWSARNDGGSSDHAIELPTRFFKVGGRDVSLKNTRRIRDSGPYDLLILEQAIRNLESYILMLSRRSDKQIAFWGHGRTYTSDKASLEEGFKIWLTKRSSWFFGYTERGTESMISNGYDRHRTTVVLNSIDTDRLRTDLDAVSDDAVLRFKRENDLHDSTGLYLGGVDEAKRIPFLLDCARAIVDSNSDFRLLIGGSGSLSEYVKQRSESEPWIKIIGPVFGAEKAVALRAAKIMLIPGRVGLVAVDSLTSGIPIVTTSWPYHAPEFEYLASGRTAVVTDDSSEAYVNGVLSVLNNNVLVAQLSKECLVESVKYSTEQMVERFLTGIESALNSR